MSMWPMHARYEEQYLILGYMYSIWTINYSWHERVDASLKKYNTLCSIRYTQGIRYKKAHNLPQTPIASPVAY